MRRFIFSQLCVLALCTTYLCTQSASMGHAAPSVTQSTLELIGQIGGGATDVEVAGGYAYVAAGSRLVVVDISSLPDMAVVGATTTLPHAVTNIALSGEYVYLAAQESGLRIVNVSDPAAPTEVGFTTGLAATGGLAPADGLVLICSNGTMQVVDVTDPTEPSVVGVHQVGLTTARDVAYSEGVAYIATSQFVPESRGRLEFVSVVDPASPSLLGYLDLDERAFTTVVADELCFAAGDGNTVWIVDVADPAQASLIGSTSIAGAYTASFMKHHADLLYIRFHNIGIAVIDVSDPENPTHVSTVSPHRWSFGGLAAQGDHLYIANEHDNFSGGGPDIHFQDGQAFWGFEAFSVSDPLQPIWAGGLSDLWFGVAAAGSENLAVIGAGGAGLRLVDTSDPAAPTQLSAQFPVADLTDIAYSGDLAYATSGMLGRLIIYNIADPNSPAEAGSYVPGGQSAWSVDVVDDRAYVTWDGELTVLDVSSPSSPGLVGTYSGVSSSHAQVVAKPPFVYVAGAIPGSQGILDVVDVSDAAAPSRVGFVRIPSYVYDVAVSGSFAYVVGKAGLTVVDVSDPTAPRIAGESAVGWDASGIAIRWPFAFVSGAGGVAAMDIANPPGTTILATLDHEAAFYLGADRPTHPWVGEDILYVPQFDQGLLILRHHLIAVATHTPTVTTTPTSSPTATPTSTPIPTGTSTSTVVASRTASPSASSTQTETALPSSTASPTASSTPSATQSPESTSTKRATGTASASHTPSPTRTEPPLRKAYVPLALMESCPPPNVFTDVVLVIDASTSMLEPTTERRSKIDVAQDAAQIFLDGLRLQSGQDRAAVVTFNDTAQTLQELTHDSSLLESALSRISIGQYTRVDLGIERATVELVARGRQGHVQAMVVLSDGMANPVSGDPVIEAAQRARLAGITVYIVGMGPSMDERVLMAMASGTSRYFPAPDPTMIRSIYADLTRRVPCPSERYWGRR